MRNAIRLTRSAAAWTLLAAIAIVGCGPKAEPPVDQGPAKEATASRAVTPATPAPFAPATAKVKEPEIVKAALAKLSPEARLGARLFYDNRIGNPGANLATSCRTCHVPAEATSGQRKWADRLALSVIPANDRGGKLETARNTTTLLDVTTEKYFPSDGQYDSLAAYLAHKLTSEHMGWRPGEAEQAKNEIQALLMNDDGTDVLAEGTYAEHFQAVKNVDVIMFSADEALNAVIASITEYLKTITTNDTPLPAGSGGEVFSRNCATCHTPPKFTDGKFHNIGITQFEYDAVHGEGAFLNYALSEPADKTRVPANTNDPQKTDLGRWNVDRQEANIGAFKTPTLRGWTGTDPYMHNGRYATIEEAIRAHLKAAKLAKAGKLRNPDPELLKISGMADADVANLMKFFEQLNEVPKE